jgi:hypothetical protein
MTMRTADELAAEGLRIRAAGGDVAFLHPSEERLAVELQCPFVRIGRIPTGGDGEQEQGR